MTTSAEFDAIYADLRARKAAERAQRKQLPLVRFWSGDWQLRGRVTRINKAEITELNNETGTASFELPIDYWMAQWVIDYENRDTANVHCTVEKDGIRWSGRMESFTVIKNDDGSGYVRILFKHDYEELKHIICYANPFLPPEFQFPRTWLLFGPSRWALKTTLMFNIMRLESSLWQIPDDPLDPRGWFNFNQSTWWMVVKPDPIGNDYSMSALVHGRFKMMHDVSKKVVEDAQLTWTFRRFLAGDPPPWPGANLRHGCLVVDLVDKSGAHSGTSFGGDIFSGLIQALFGISGDGLDEGIDVINDPNFPELYYDPNFLGTLPKRPWVIYRDGPRTGIQTSEFTVKPATDVGVVAGGHSMPGVNEVISAGIQMVGDLTASIPLLPPLGGFADALLKPLYTDVFLAFGKMKDFGRASRLGKNHYHEHWAEGADKAYTLAYLLAMRSGFWATREQVSHEVVVADGAPYLVGAQGFGHFYLGDRVGSTVRGMPPGRVFVDQVSSVSLSWDRQTAPGWKITIGHRDIKDPAVKAMEQLQEVMSVLQELGVV